MVLLESESGSRIKFRGNIGTAIGPVNEDSSTHVHPCLTILGDLAHTSSALLPERSALKGAFYKEAAPSLPPRLSACGLVRPSLF